MEIDPAIAALATEGLVDSVAFDALPVRTCKAARSAIQTILDLGLRAAIPQVHPAFRRALPLLAARLAGASPISCVARIPDPWQDAARAAGVEVEIASPAEATDPAWQKGRRDGVLVVECFDPGPEAQAVVQALAREWPRALLWGRSDSLDEKGSRIFGGPRSQEQNAGFHWSEARGAAMMAMAMHPDAPTQLLVTNSRHRREVLHTRGFAAHRPSDIAFLFRVVVPTE